MADMQGELAQANVSVDIEKAKAQAASARAEGEAAVITTTGAAEATRTQAIGQATASAEEALGLARAKGFEAQRQAIGSQPTAMVAALLHEDATLSMPPYALWLQGPENVWGWKGPGHGCAGARGIPVAANGTFAFGQYRPAPGGTWEPGAVQVIEMADAWVTAVNSFLDTDGLFPLFGLPEDPDHPEA